ncbi:MAG: metallophosphoesterase family protein [Bacteroidota bacterium]|nr:metallophosphoesterase family protein [Bacteroidota bacterium]
MSLLSLLLSGVEAAQKTNSDKIPDRIILNLTTQPSTSIAVTWRTIVETINPSAQISETSEWIEFTSSAKHFQANKERLVLDNGKSVYQYSVIFNGLQPNTKYCYRVGGDSIWSEWNQFGTAENKTAPFAFLYFGDAQHGLKTFYPRIAREANRKHPEAKFWLFSGDLIDRPQYDSLWYEFFYASNFIHSYVPSVMVPGNHEYGKEDSSGEKISSEMLIDSWKPHFTLPENGIMGLEETSYSFVYQGVRFVMLNGNEKLQEQAKWLDSVLSKKSEQWVIATVHQPLYSMSKTRDQRKTRDAFLEVFDKYSIDLVLQGHDHVYARSATLVNGAKVNATAKGTVYVTSNSGSDSYRINPLYSNLMDKFGTDVQLYQVVSINGRKLSFSAYTATGAVYDTFELIK